MLRYPDRYVLALFILLLPICSFALSCRSTPFTLQQAYDQSEAIVIALVSHCELPDGEDTWTAGGDGCSLTTLEVLKASSPVRDYTSTANSSGCGLSLHVGQQYLLFLGEDNRVLPYTSFIDSGAKDRRLNVHYVETLRAYRDGYRKDLAEPWFFSDANGVCSLAQRVGANRIRFNAGVLPGLDASRPDWTVRRFDDGLEYRRQVASASNSAKEDDQDLSIFTSVPDLMNQVQTVQVEFDDVRPAPSRISVISIDGHSWPLHEVRIRRRMNGRMLKEAVHYTAGESAAASILDRLDSETEFSVSALEIAESQTSSERNSVPRQYGAPITAEQVIRMDSKSTGIGPALTRYRDCVANLDD